MKYLLIDTNIYLNMIIARDQSHKPESYDYLLNLLNHGEVRLLVPEIVKTEVYRHLNKEVDKIEETLKGAKTTIEKLYWINNNDELNKFNEKLKPLKEGLKDLVGEFNSNKKLYIENSDELIKKLFNHDNTIILSESKNIVIQATKRQIHQLRPFHFGETKNSLADAIIIETMINIKELIDFNEDDSIYFISRNPEDFSIDKKDNLEKFHTDISESLSKMGISNQIHYRVYFTKTLLNDFEDEIEYIGIKENLILEKNIELQELESYWKDLDRESVGLGSLSSNYDEKIDEEVEFNFLLATLEDFGSDLNGLYDEYLELYVNLEERLANLSLEDIVKFVENFNSTRPLVDIYTDKTFTKEDYIDEIFSLVNKFCIDVEDINIDDMFNYKENFEQNTTLATIINFEGSIYNVESTGYITPEEGETNTIEIKVLKDNISITKGNIELIYGYVEFDENNNVGEALDDSIDTYLADVIIEINRIEREVLGYLLEKKGILERIIGNLGISFSDD